MLVDAEDPSKLKIRAGPDGSQGWPRRLPDGSLASHTTMVPSHFNAPPANMRTRAVQGRRRTHVLAVGPAARKITRARNQKRPGTSGGGRNQEGEASGRDSFRRACPRAGGGIRRWAVFQRGSAHEPSPLVRELHCERLCRAQVVGILGSTGVGSPLSTPLNRPCAGLGGWASKCQGSIAAGEARRP